MLSKSDKLLGLSRNVPALKARARVERYPAWAALERGLRSRTSQLDLAPGQHRRPDRLRAPPWICCLALGLQRGLR